MRTNRFSPQGRAADIASRDRVVMQEIEKEQKARDKKSARLRALRLAKEASEKEGSEKAEAERLAAAERTLKSSIKKPARIRKRSAVGKMDESAERPTQLG
jgi:predicted negative regulator of RcsB-dependent stress response